MKKELIIALSFLLCLVLLFGIAVGGYFAAYSMAVKRAQSGDLEGAGKLLFLPGVTALHDPLLKDYMDAVEQAEAGEHSEAIKLFYALSEEDYRDSYDRMVEAQYDYAVQVMESGDYYRAIALLSEADRLGHDDAEEAIARCNYLWAQELLDRGKTAEAFAKLKEADDLDEARDLLKEMTEQMYTEGVELYRSGEVGMAFDIFQLIPNYKDSEKYIALILVRGGVIHDRELLEELFYFEDTAQVLMRDTNSAFAYLDGTWVSSDGRQTLQIWEDNGKGYYYLDGFDFDLNFAYIADGVWYNTTRGHAQVSTQLAADDPTLTPVLQLRLLGPDVLEVTCLEDGAVYVLRRQTVWQRHGF